MGVTEIEMTNWTKTREPDEIEDGEKKLNSYYKLAEFNHNILESDVESITDLYEETTGKLREINNLSSNNLQSLSVQQSVATNLSLDNLNGNYDNYQGTSNVNISTSDDNIGVKNEDLNVNDDNYVNSVDNNDNNINSNDNNINNNDIGTDDDVNNFSNSNDSYVNYVGDSNVDDDIENDDTNDEITDEKLQVKGNKVLRTCFNLEGFGGSINYTTTALSGYLKSDRAINWDKQNKVTWDLCTSYDSEKKVNSVEWRMLSAKVNISQEQKKLLNEKSAFAVFGIPTDNETGFELIMPCNDVVSVFVNELNTNINYHNRMGGVKYKLNNNLVNFKSMINSDNECLDKTYHEELSDHTDGYHVDMANLNKYIASSSLSSRETIELDLKKYLTVGTNYIDILVGNYIVDENYINKSCGFSKLNLYIIEKPKIDIQMMFYKYKNGERVFFDDSYRPKKDEEVFVRFDIINISENLDFSNISVERLLESANKKTNIKFKANENSAFYGNTDITNSLRCYLNEDFSKEYNLEILQNLEVGQKITLMSDDMVYTILDDEAKSGHVLSYLNVSASYINNKLKFVSDEKTMRACVSQDFGALKIKCSIEDESDELLSDDTSNINDASNINNSNNINDASDARNFLVNVNSDEDFSNLYIKSGQTYTLENLNISDCYYINLVLPQDYEVVDSDTYSNSSQNKVCLSASNNYTQTIEIKLKKKGNQYFYKNKQGEVKINVGQDNV